jgi:hypothetical protein
MEVKDILLLRERGVIWNENTSAQEPILKPYWLAHPWFASLPKPLAFQFADYFSEWRSKVYKTL